MSGMGHLRRGDVHGTSAMAPIATEDIHHLLVDLWRRRIPDNDQAFYAELREQRPDLSHIRYEVACV